MSPLLTGTAADRARAVIADIAAALRDPSVYDADPGLRAPDVGRGSAGAALLFAELAAESGSAADAETALVFLDASLEQASEERPNALLYPGTVGVGWTLAYLEGGLVDPDPDENDVDALVAHALSSGTWPSNDLIRGVAGCGVYLVERGRPADLVVERLTEMSVTTADGVTWWVDPATCLPDRAAAFPEGYYDLGIAHGQAGVIALLAHLVARGDDDARPLLEGATQWLLAQRLPDGMDHGRYPSIVAADPRPRGGSRLAWCYGDPGVAVGLYAAGRALGDEAIVKEAVDTAYAAAARPDDEAGVVDAPLCHGSAGLLHIFNRLWQQTGDERLAEAARHWFDVALAQRRPSEPVAGYGAMRPPQGGGEFTYEPLAGFLEGATGVALAMLSAVIERETGWDLLLLTKPVT